MVHISALWIVNVSHPHDSGHLYYSFVLYCMVHAILLTRDMLWYKIYSIEVEGES